MKTLHYVLAIVVLILVTVVVLTSARAEIISWNEFLVREGYTTWSEINKEKAEKAIEDAAKSVYLLPHETFTPAYTYQFNWLDWLTYLYPAPAAPAASTQQSQTLVAPNTKGQYPYPYQFPVGDLNAPMWWYMDYGQWQDRQEEIYRRKGAFDFPTKGQQLRTVPSKGALIRYGTNQDIESLKWYK